MVETASIGDNSGAFEPMDVAREAMTEALRPHWARFRVLEESVGRATCDDDDTAGKVVDLDAMFLTLIGRVDMAHGTVKAPYLEAGRVVDGLANALRAKIDPLREKLNALTTAYQTEKQNKIDAAREAERAAEAKDPEPMAPAPASTRRAIVDKGRRGSTIRGDFGASASLRDVDRVEIVDVKKLPKWLLEHADVQAAIAKVAKPVLKAGQKVPGCKLATDMKSVTRK